MHTFLHQSICFESTYKELKFRSRDCWSGRTRASFESTYKELKSAILGWVPDIGERFESTYKELKSANFICAGCLIAKGFESTYKELKFHMLDKHHPARTRFESTYKELKYILNPPFFHFHHSVLSLPIRN